MYDFENDDLPDDERRSYKLIRWWLLGCYYTYCRSKIRASKKGHQGGWVPNEHEIGYAYEQYEDSYSLPIEQLMLEMLALILNAGRGPKKAELYHRAKIASILEKHDLTDMLKTLQGEERQEFEHDLKLLELL